MARGGGSTDQATEDQRKVSLASILSFIYTDSILYLNTTNLQSLVVCANEIFMMHVEARHC